MLSWWINWVEDEDDDLVAIGKVVLSSLIIWMFLVVVLMLSLVILNGG